MAAHHLADRTRGNGMFVYRTNMDASVPVAERYNILRHAGTIYGMAMYDAVWPDEKVRSAMLRAGRWLLDEAVSPVPETDGKVLAVWSSPEVNKSGAPLQAKLGGAGLGLVALLSIEAVKQGFTPIETLRGLGRFILYMQKPEGSFYSKYIPASGGRVDIWESLYYPGEATLGLVMLYEKDPDPAWLSGAARALGFLAQSRRGATDVPYDHWALIATERLFALPKPVVLQEEMRQLLTGHAAQICAGMLGRYEGSRKPGDDRGIFATELSVTQVACTLEGLLAALAVIPADHGLRPRMESAVKDGVAFLMGVQVADGDYRGAFPRMAPLPAGRKQAAPDPRATEVRIDYTQHALSALVRYARLFPAAGK
ncbi:MAG: hypothetical protein ACOZBW_02780 [Thermodesulfobacteriota bacterium]